MKKDTENKSDVALFLWKSDLLTCHKRHRVSNLKKQVIGAISSHLGVESDRVVLGRHASGKPFIQQPQTSLNFNLSHCDDKVVLALSWSHEVGVDIESTTKARDYLHMAKFYYSKQEYMYLKLKPNDLDKRKAFYKLWTLKECSSKSHQMALPQALRLDFSSHVEEDVFSSKLNGRMSAFNTIWWEDCYVSTCYFKVS